MLVSHLRLLLASVIVLLSQTSASSSSPSYKWQKTALSSIVNLVYPSAGEAQANQYTAFGTGSKGDISGVYWTLSISLLCPNGTTLPILSTYNVNTTYPSFNASKPYSCGNVNEAQQKNGTTTLFKPTFMTDVGEYVATWNFTYTFPEQVDASGEDEEGVMCTGVGSSETEIISRNITVVPSIATPTLPPWETVLATFTVQPTGDIYTFMPVSGSGQRIRGSGSIWAMWIVGGSLGLLMF
ncbi:hypothetical protein DL93DRAFT_1879262 [Clavulina sp. PMI_390]|nr:hypothetical protein DL93DRAFT_1879262 [Clavulina sp. PMI_390]